MLSDQLKAALDKAVRDCADVHTPKVAAVVRRSAVATAQILESDRYQSAFDAVLYADGDASPIAIGELSRLNGYIDAIRIEGAEEAGLSEDAFHAAMSRIIDASRR